jgi:hypothetical protein
LSAAYPVGSIYINATSASNPSTLLGFGTWTAFGAGRVLVGLDAGDALFDTAEETGGTKDAVVVSHSHTATSSSSVSDPGHSHNIIHLDNSSTAGSNLSGANSQNGQVAVTETATTGITVATTTTVNSTGVSGTNANVQPYITVRMWKRTA